MYVTRPLSMYLRDPSALSIPPPEGPNSGILVIQDEEAEPTCCFGLCKSDQIGDLPFPQNKNLKVVYTTTTSSAGGHAGGAGGHAGGAGGHTHTSTSTNRVLFIPVLNQPLSSNQYFVIERSGKHKGEAYTNSKEEDMTTCCFCNCITDLKPESLDPQDIYQQFEIRRRSWGSFVAKSVAPDGFPPEFLRKKGWRVHTSTPREFELDEALGLDSSLRSRLPDFNFPSSQKHSAPVVVGKWYVPFMFVKERTLKDQMLNAVYYEMTLQQEWQQFFACGNNNNEGKAVAVDALVETEEVALGGSAVQNRENVVVDGFMWFRNSNNMGGETSDVGLSLAVVERMKWEQERFHWVSGGSEGQVRVKSVEEFGKEEWRRFGCYVLVERFVLRRMDGSLVLTYSFRHTHHIRCKWE